MLRPLFEGLKKLVEVFPFQLVGDIHQKLLLHFKLNLTGLPDLSITEEMLAALIQPIMQKVKEVHTEIVKKIREVVWGQFLYSGAIVFFGWVQNLENCMRWRSVWNDSDAEMKISPLPPHCYGVVLTQHEKEERKSEKKSALPTFFQRATSFKKMPPEN